MKDVRFIAEFDIQFLMDLTSGDDQGDDEIFKIWCSFNGN